MIPSSYLFRETMREHLGQPRRPRVPDGVARRDRTPFASAATVLGGWVTALDALHR